MLFLERLSRQRRRRTSKNSTSFAILFLRLPPKLLFEGLIPFSFNSRNRGRGKQILSPCLSQLVTTALMMGNQSVTAIHHERRLSHGRGYHHRQHHFQHPCWSWCYCCHRHVHHLQMYRREKELYVVYSPHLSSSTRSGRLTSINKQPFSISPATIIIIFKALLGKEARKEIRNGICYLL